MLQLFQAQHDCAPLLHFHVIFRRQDLRAHDLLKGGLQAEGRKMLQTIQNENDLKRFSKHCHADSQNLPVLFFLIVMKRCLPPMLLQQVVQFDAPALAAAKKRTQVPQTRIGSTVI